MRVRALPLLVMAAVVIGLECILIFQPWNDIGVDFDRVIAAGQIWRAGGDPYRLTGYLYTPAMTMIASFVPPGTWIFWALIEVALVVSVAPRNWWGLAVALIWPGVWLDIALGNVTIALVAAALLAIRWDRPLAGLPLGIALALAPKPMFALLIVWLAIHRRCSFVGVVAGAVLCTSVGLLVTGAGSYGNFFGALLTGVDVHFVGNSGLSYVSPALGAAAYIIAALVCLRYIGRQGDGLMAAAIAGLFAGTYVGLYATVLPLAVLPGFATVRPIAATRIAMVGLFAPFVLWASGIAAMAIVALQRGSDGSQAAQRVNEDDSVVHHVSPV